MVKAISASDGATIESPQMVARAKSKASMLSTKVTMIPNSSSNSAANTRTNHSFPSSSPQLKVSVADLAKVETFTPTMVSNNNSSSLGADHLRAATLSAMMFKPQ